jgi:hypothetical protein
MAVSVNIPQVRPLGTSLVTSAHAYNKMYWQRVSMDRYGI